MATLSQSADFHVANAPWSPALVHAPAALRMRFEVPHALAHQRRAIDVLVAHAAPLIAAGVLAVLSREDDLVVTLLETAEDLGQGRVPPGPPYRVIVTDYETALPLLSHGGVYGAPGERSRILIVTRRVDATDVAAALQAGADGYFMLGASLAELVQGVRALAQGGRYLCAALQSAGAPRETVEAPRARPSGGLPAGALKRVREHIEQCLAEKIELHQLASIARLSECHFARAFKQSTGMPPHRYLMLQRVRVAADLIRQTDRSLTDISLDVGFSDQSHFTRTFARTTGETPRAFRHRHR
jgi:AraC-like DNA-binding protein